MASNSGVLHMDTVGVSGTVGSIEFNLGCEIMWNAHCILTALLVSSLNSGLIKDILALSDTPLCD